MKTSKTVIVLLNILTFLQYVKEAVCAAQTVLEFLLPEDHNELLDRNLHHLNCWTQVHNSEIR